MNLEIIQEPAVNRHGGYAKENPKTKIKPLNNYFGTTPPHVPPTAPYERTRYQDGTPSVAGCTDLAPDTQDSSEKASPTIHAADEIGDRFRSYGAVEITSPIKERIVKTILAERNSP